METHKPSNPTFDALLALVPTAPDWRIDWDQTWRLYPEFAVLDQCPQDPIHHAEGDVGTHTRMVVDELVGLPEWQGLPKDEREFLFWAACFHDIGKPGTTQFEEGGRISSRGHSRLGASIARNLMRASHVEFNWRERVCAIVSKHQLPFWLIERPNAERLAITTSLVCRPDLLCLHAEADARGRICADRADVVDRVALARVLFSEMACINQPFPFANDESRLGFLEREDRDPNYTAYEDFACTAHVMSALPGSGKDTWINTNLPDLPMVSLDTIREEIGAAPTGNQGRVVQAAYERAKAHLRAGKDFVWNATNVTEQTRAKVLRLMRDYNARIHIVYLEVAPDMLMSQNDARDNPIPASVIENLSKKLEPPTASEAHEVTYVIR